MGGRASYVFFAFLTLVVFNLALITIPLSLVQAQSASGSCNGTTSLLTAPSHSVTGVFNPGVISDGVALFDGAPWNAQETAIYEEQSGEIVWKLPEPASVVQVAIQADNNDTYHLEGSTNGSDWREIWAASPVAGAGLRTRFSEEIQLPTAPLFVRLRASGGDRHFSVSELSVNIKPLSCAAESRGLPRAELQSSIGSGKLHFPAVEFRVGLGATEWLMPWAVALIASILLWLFSRCYLARDGRGSLRESLKELGRRQSRVCTQVDLRALAAFRIALAIVLFTDLWQRWSARHIIYLSDAVVPVREALQGKGFFNPFTLFHLFSSDAAIYSIFLLGFVAAAAMLLGVTTKISQIVALITTLTLQNGEWYGGHSGHMVMRITLLWSLFLPLGAAWSIDARGSLNNQKAPVVLRHWAFTVLLLQLSTIYFFNTLHKFSAEWQNGSLLYLVLFDDGLTRPLGVWLREHLPIGGFKTLTYLALLVEGAAPFLLLSPLKTKWCRTVALCFLLPLHLGIALVMPLTIFSLIMISLVVLTTSFCPSQSGAGAVAPAVQGSPIITQRWSNSFITCGKVLSLIFAVWFGAASISQLIRENEPLWRWFSHKPQPYLQVTLDASRTYQGWCMFASCFERSYAPNYDALVVEGVLQEDGRRIDMLRSLFEGKMVPAPGTYRDPPVIVSHELFHSFHKALRSGNPVVVKGFTRWIHSQPFGADTGRLQLDFKGYLRWTPNSVTSVQNPLRLVMKRDIGWDLRRTDESSQRVLPHSAMRSMVE